MAVKPGSGIGLEVAVERWPISGTFTIARGSKSLAEVVVVTLRQGEAAGRGECVPYARYGESLSRVLAAIESLRAPLAAGLSRSALQHLLPPGAARNAIDCALWDLQAKRTGVPVATALGLGALHPVETAFTISLGTPAVMAAQAKEAASRYSLLKLKLGGAGDASRLSAVREAVPDARLIADANEAWAPEQLGPLMQAAASAGIDLIEQPLAAGHDAALSKIDRPVPVCADESVHVRGDLACLKGRYDAVNIKLDKAGGLSEAAALFGQARAAGVKIMIGCMVGTSLAMAPAALLAQEADWVDLDGPLLLRSDRKPGLTYEGGLLFPPERALWG